jgi:ankyrin repeat protein
MVSSFLLAQLLFDSLKDKNSVAKVRAALDQFNFRKRRARSSEDWKLEVLNSAYDEAMERIDRQLPNLRKLAKDVLFWVACARRPLSTVELQHAMAVEDNKGPPALIMDNLPDVEDMVAACAGLVTADSKMKIVRLVHKTTQEYFDRMSEKWVPDAHATIARTCATYLSLKGFSGGLCTTTKEFKSRLRAYPLYQFAALNWGFHARQAHCDEVINFLTSEGQVEAASQVLHLHGRLRESGSRLSNCFDPDGLDCFDAKWLPHQVKGLHLAAYFGLERVTAQLLARNDDPNTKTSQGRTPLSYAAEKGHKGVVRALLATGQVEVDGVTDDNYAPLYYAILGGHGAVVQMLLESGLVDLPAYCCGNLLHDAAETGCEFLVRVLLAADLVGVNWENVDRFTALHRAAEHGQTSIVRMLLATGKADINIESVEGTPLILAARAGHDAVVQLLLATNQVHVNTVDPLWSHMTPLMYAAERGSSSVVRALLATGQVDVNARDGNGQTALHHAAGVTFADGQVLETVKLLLGEDQIEVDAKDIWHRNPLSYASEAGHELGVQALLATAHADPDTKTRAPLTQEAGGYMYEAHALHGRQLRGPRIRNFLTKGEDGWTPLTYAIKRGHKTVANFLRAHGAQDAGI